MGNCTSKSLQVIQPMRILRQAQLEHRTQNAKAYLFTLKFRSFQLLGSPHSGSYISIHFHDQSVQSDAGIEDEYHKYTYWEFSWDLSHTCTINQLANEILTIEVFSKTTQISILQLNLYDIARGPTQHNICLDKHSKSGRLSFNIELFQMTDVEVSADKLKCCLEYPEDSEFMLELKIISARESGTIHLPKTRVPKWHMRQDYYTDEIPKLVFPATIADIRISNLNLKL